jgi:hypothetical protein
MSVVIYTSSTSGHMVNKNSERMKALVKGVLKKDCNVVYLDLEEHKAKRTEIWAISGKSHVYPLLFRGTEFVGAIETVNTLVVAAIFDVDGDDVVVCFFFL